VKEFPIEEFNFATLTSWVKGFSSWPHHEDEVQGQVLKRGRNVSLQQSKTPKSLIFKHIPSVIDKLKIRFYNHKVNKMIMGNRPPRCKGNSGPGAGDFMEPDVMGKSNGSAR
jgi:hypothetical protein